MASEVSKYTLESAYKNVERDALERTQPQEHPRAILLGGQPGAGKSELAAEAVRELKPSGGAVVIDADRMREENPRYKALSKEDPQNAADRTQKEAGEWATRLTMTAAENHRNLVVDGTMRSPDNIRDLTTRLKSEGYEVEARVLAVSAETSITRARLRFEEQVAERGTGRFVNQTQHDNAYEGMPKTVGTLERDKLVDAVRVYDANQRPIYENRLEQGEWVRAKEVGKVIEQERGRELTHAEKRDYVSALEDIAALTRQRTQQPDKAIEAKLDSARTDLARTESSPAFQRAEAFDRSTKAEALAKHPELDGAFKQLQEARRTLTPDLTQDEKERSYFNARAEISNQLHRGEVPRGPVTKEESEQVIGMAASSRNLMVRDATELRQDVKGEVVASSTHHTLVKVSDMVAIRFERANLDRDAEAGEKVTIQHGAAKSQVYEQGKEPSKDLTRDPGRDIGR